jgi:uncharacterized protein DUF6230
MSTTAAVAPALGGTRWRRFALAFGASFAAICTVLVLMATGAIALPVTISGTHFKVSADSLVAHSNPNGPAFVQYGAVDLVGGAPDSAVAVTELPAGGTLTNLDQVVCGDTGIPIPGWQKLIVELQATSADATNGLVVDATDLTASGTATFDNIKIGVPVTGRTGSTFGQTADGVSINGVNQDAVYTQAGTFKLSGLHLHASHASSCPS